MELISDKDLLQQLTLPDTVSASDPESAMSALAAHFRTRAYPVCPPLDSQVDRRGHGVEIDTVIEEADRVCDHIFTFVGHPPQQLGSELAWNEDPVDYDQWAISFNRHFHWISLAKAYEATDDEKYAKEFVEQLRSWIAAMPVEIGDRWVQAGWATEGRMSLSLDAGIRMGQTWVHAFYAFLRSPHFTDADVIAMVKAFHEHALYLMDPVHFRSFSNWGVMEANGLYHIGVYFPEFTESSSWRETAMRRLRQEIDLQVYPDGAQIELTSGYHHVSLRNFVLAYEAARHNDLEVPPDYLAGLERMYHYSLYVSFPDLRMPAVNDSDEYPILSAMREAHEYFPDRSDFTWVATEGASGTPLDPSSTAFPYAGHFVMRSGWDPDDPCLFFDGGPYGYAHQHEDKLNVILYGHGRILIQDPGNYQYDTSEWRTYMLSTWSHNTITVDGQGQQRKGRPKQDYVIDGPLPHTWVSQPDFDYASAAYDDGYGPDVDRTVTHRRSIMFLKPDLWIVTDLLTPSDDAEHEYESPFIFDAESATAENLVASSASSDLPGAAILAIAPPGTDLRIAVGERDPIRGWAPPSGDKTQCVPTPTAVYRFSGSGSLAITYVVTPVPPGESSRVVSASAIPAESADGHAIAGEIGLADGRTIHFVQRPPGSQRVVFGPLETDAEAAVVVSAEGRVEAIHTASGASVVRNGEALSTGDAI